MLRFKVKNADPYIIDKHESMHRIYASACLKKSDNGALVVKDYTDMLLLSTSDILEENRLAQLKQISKVVPFTIATFIGSSGRTLKIIARVTLPDLPRRENEAEMEQFYRKAYKVAAAIYSSLLNVPVSPAGIKDGSSPVMANCLISADAAPFLIEKTTPLDVDGVELAPMSQSEIVKTNDNNEVSALISFLTEKYKFRYNIVRGATEYLDKQKPYWGWRVADTRFINGLSLEARLSGVEARPKDVIIYLNSSHIRVIDPVEDYLFNLTDKWDGHDHIGDLADRVKTDLVQWKQWFRMWFYGMVAQWMGYNSRYGNSIVPLLVAPQGYHKSTFCRQLLPQDLRWGYLDNLKFDNQKLVMQSMVDFLLINIDEFNSISKKTQEGFLKNTIQLASIAIKRPYSRRVEAERRRASFIATSNMTDVLSDPCGSRRFFVVDVTSPIDTDKPINYEQLYAQAMHAIANGERYWFDYDENEEIIEHNRQYQLLSPAEQYFRLCFAVTQDESEGQYMTTAAIYNKIKGMAGSSLGVRGISKFGQFLANLDGIVRKRTKVGTMYLVKPL